jgi:hypothetical protein
VEENHMSVIAAAEAWGEAAKSAWEVSHHAHNAAETAQANGQDELAGMLLMVAIVALAVAVISVLVYVARN